MIDLRSDTVTKPSKDMLEYMFHCEVGDDVFEEDPTAIKLQHNLAERFGKEAGLFFPSGVMCNQVAIKCHTQPMDEIICDESSHIYTAENGGWAFHSGVSIKLLKGERGIFSTNQVKEALQPKADWLPNSSLLCVENTVNKGGGAVWPIHQLEEMSTFAKHHHLKFHMDGARIFNALTASPTDEKKLGHLFDSISICFSKGLGTPVGSVLLGTQSYIHHARKWRKAFGGGMRQIGILAGACLYALEHNLPLLAQDHRRAKVIGDLFATKNYVQYIYPVESNIVLIRLTESLDPSAFIHALHDQGIRCVPFGKQQVRFVTHLNFDDIQLEQTINGINKLTF
jgi:threonine aldolase